MMPPNMPPPGGLPPQVPTQPPGGIPQGAMPGQIDPAMLAQILMSQGQGGQGMPPAAGVGPVAPQPPMMGPAGAGQLRRY